MAEEILTLEQVLDWHEHYLDNLEISPVKIAHREQKIEYTKVTIECLKELKEKRDLTFDSLKTIDDE